MNVSLGVMGQVVRSQPVDDPVADPSAKDDAAQLKPVPLMSVVQVPLGQPLYQQHSDKAVFTAI